MNEELKSWAANLRKMDKENRNPAEIWEAFQEHSAEMQAILFGPTPDVALTEAGPKPPSDDQEAAGYIALLLENRGWTSSQFSGIRIELSRSQPSFICELRSPDGSTLPAEPLISYELLHSDVRDECRELQFMWQVIHEHPEGFLDSIRGILLEKLSGWESVQIDVVD